MNRTEIMAKLNEIFCDVFDDEDIVLTDATNSDDIEDWDSLEQINLLVSIEKQFSIKFSLADVAELENVGSMVDLIERMVG